MAMFNLTLVSPILPELVEGFDLSELAIGAFTSAEMVAYVVFAPIWGAASDRRGARRPLVLLGLGASAPLFALMPSVPSFPALLMLRFVQGAFTVAAWSLAMTMALDWAGAGDRGRTMGILGGGMMLGMAMGAPVGGMVGERGGTPVPFYVAAGVFAFALLLAASLLREPRIEVGRGRPMGDILGRLKGHRELWIPCAYSFVDRFTAGFFITLFPVMLLRSFDFPAGLRGLYLGIFFLPFALFQYPFGRLIDRLGPLPFIIGGSVFYGCVMVTVARLDPGPLAGAMFVLGALAASLLPASLVLVARMSTPAIHGVAMGMFNAMGSVGFAVGLLASGAMGDAWGHQAAFTAGGLSVLVVVAVTAVPLLLRHGGGQARTGGREPA